MNEKKQGIFTRIVNIFRRRPAEVDEFTSPFVGRQHAVSMYQELRRGHGTIEKLKSVGMVSEAEAFMEMIFAVVDTKTENGFLSTECANLNAIVEEMQNVCRDVPGDGIIDKMIHLQSENAQLKAGPGTFMQSAGGEA